MGHHCDFSKWAFISGYGLKQMGRTNLTLTTNYLVIVKWNSLLEIATKN